MSRIIQIKLRNFRNHPHLSLSFDAAMVNILGPNGAGKTSVLEAMTVFQAGQGVRSARMSDMISSGQQFLRVECVLENDEIKHDILFHYATKKEIHLNRSTVSKYSELKDLLDFICFSPQIYARFLGGQQFRRQFFDRIVFSFCHDHLKIFYNYDHLRQERQKLLNAFDADQVWLGILEERMSGFANKIYENRQYCLDILQPFLTEIGCKIELDDEFWRESVKKDLPSRKKILAELLRHGRDLDRRYKQTRCGPQRSTVNFFYRDRHFDHCSSGEQKKLLVLILLMQVRAKINLRPILLFDDIVSQFDQDNMEEIVDFIKDLRVQCFITYTERYSSLWGQEIFLK